MKGDDDWRLWRQKMVHMLLKSQASEEGLSGSWFDGWAGAEADPGSKLLPDEAGRLGITALCLATLRNARHVDVAGSSSFRRGNPRVWRPGAQGILD